MKEGDKLTTIAFAYNVSRSEILKANHLEEGAVLKAGEILNIPWPISLIPFNPEPADVAPTTTTPGHYSIKKGDTPTSIAHRYGLTTEELLKANKITDWKSLLVGQILKVPPHGDR